LALSRGRPGYKVADPKTASSVIGTWSVTGVVAVAEGWSGLVKVIISESINVQCKQSGNKVDKQTNYVT